MGLGPIDWMGDPHWAMPAIVILAVWKNFGYNMIILLAALQNIPEDLYEAARIDGASGWQVFRHITLPGLGPVLLLVSILTMTGYFQLFAEPYVMTEGGPLQSTLERSVFHVRGRLQVVEPRARIGGRLSAVRAHVRRDAGAVADGPTGSANVKRIHVLTPHTSPAAGCTGREFDVAPCENNAASMSPVFRAYVFVECQGRRINQSFLSTYAENALDHRSQRHADSSGVAHGVSAVLDGLGFLHAHRRCEFVSAAAAAAIIRRSTTTAILFSRHSAGRYIFNSALVATLATADLARPQHDGGLRVCETPLSRPRSNLSGRCSGALVIPAQVTMIPLFAIVKRLGLVSTYGGVLVPILASVFGIFLVRQYALSLPDELLEAARIDGASEGRIFWSLVMPLLRPILVTLAILTFLATWNDFMWPLIVLTDQKLHTLPVALAGLVARTRAGQ